MARKQGQAYVVNDGWRERVEAALKARKWTRSDLARESDVPKSVITELLNGKRDSCVDLPKIYKALEWRWDASLPLVSADAGELLGLWDHLDDFHRGRLLERARAMYEAIEIKGRRGD